VGAGSSEDIARCPSGVYSIDATERRRILAGDVFPPGFHIAVFDDAVATRAGFFQELARALRFPDYFGHNWDAVYDCLTDLNWLPAAGYVLVLDGFAPFAMNEPGQWDIGLKVLWEACAFWTPLRTPMYVLLFGQPDLAPGVPPLPAECWPTAYPVSAS
jgi:hypothetical protein